MKMTLAEALEAIERGETPEQYQKRIKRIKRLANERDTLEFWLSVCTAPEEEAMATKKRARLAAVLQEIERLK